MFFKQERFNIVTRAIYLVIDLILIYLSFYLPYIIRWNIFFDWGEGAHNLASWQGILFPSIEQYTRLYVFWGTITVLFLGNQNLYKTNRLFSIFEEAALVLKSVLYSTLVTGMVVFFIKAIAISRLVFIGNFIFLCISLSLWRIMKRLALRQLILKGYNNFNVLIAGCGRIAEELVREVQNNTYLGLKIVGFLDDNGNKAGQELYGYKVLGGIADFEKIIHQNFVDEVLITVPENRNAITRMLELGREMNVGVRVIPNPFELATEVLNVYRIGHLPLLSYSIKNFHKADLVGKRIMDITLSILGLVLLSPLFIVLAILIKLSDRGPVFYVSKRYGRKGRVFDFYKFRSMVTNAEEALKDLKDKNEKDGPIFKIKNDPRVSKLGKFIRKHSIDELPQLWNVLKGDMSIVGPRPLPIGQVQKHDFSQLKRLEIKPGITGLWQIRGRSDTSFQRLVQWDTWYINNWSLWLDFAVIFRTISVVIKGKGAY